MSGILQESWLGEVVAGWKTIWNYMLLKNAILLQYHCYEMKLWCKEQNT